MRVNRNDEEFKLYRLNVHHDQAEHWRTPESITAVYYPEAPSRCDHMTDHMTIQFHASAKLRRPNWREVTQVDRWAHTHIARLLLYQQTYARLFAHSAYMHQPTGREANCQRFFFFFFPGRLCHRTANQRTAWEMSLCPRSCSCQGWGFIAVHFVALSKIGGTGTWPCEEKNLSVFFSPLKISCWNIYWTVSRLQSKTAGFKPTDVIQSVLKRFQWVFSQLTVQQLWNRME